MLTTPSHLGKNKGLYTTLGRNALEKEIAIAPKLQRTKRSNNRKAA